MRKTEWITLDYLEFFCEQNSLVIGCTRGGEEVWISPLGPHPSDLTSDEVRQILEGSAQFELRKASVQDSEITLSEFLTRAELEQQIRRLMN
jgi:hypothetical protein